MRRFAVLPRLAPALLVVAGCYRYTPLPAGAAPTPGAQVRAHLTEAGTQRFADRLGPATVAVEGRLLRWEGTSAVVAVARTVGRDSTDAIWTEREAFTFPREAVAGFDRRALDTRRTLTRGALTLAGFLAIGRAVSAIGGGGSSSGPVTTPPPL